MRFAFILAEKDNFPIELMCKVLEVCRSSSTHGCTVSHRSEPSVAPR